MGGNIDILRLIQGRVSCMHLSSHSFGVACVGALGLPQHAAARWCRGRVVPRLSACAMRFKIDIDGGNIIICAHLGIGILMVRASTRCGTRPGMLAS